MTRKTKKFGNDFGLKIRRRMKNILLLILGLLAFPLFAQQKRVAITMDDMPYNVAPHFFSLEEARNMNMRLLEKIQKAGTPVAAFLTGNDCIRVGEAEQRLAVLKAWIDHPLISLGNHTYSHSNYAQSSFEQFRQDIEKNEWLVEVITKDSIPYFRFPFNATGGDSTSRMVMEEYLLGKGYEIAPFTLESVDYLFNALYQEAIRAEQADSAHMIAQAYIDFTVATFRYYEGVSEEVFGRPIAHIFLCHGNLLHADYYLELIAALKEEGYTFISLKEALKDPIYSQTDHYHKKWGISWIYRWIEDPEERMTWMRKGIEPSKEWYQRYAELKD